MHLELAASALCRRQAEPRSNSQVVKVAVCANRDPKSAEVAGEGFSTELSVLLTLLLPHLLNVLHYLIGRNIVRLSGSFDL
jgi:hypothetical protein